MVQWRERLRWYSSWENEVFLGGKIKGNYCVCLFSNLVAFDVGQLALVMIDALLGERQGGGVIF